MLNGIYQPTTLEHLLYYDIYISDDFSNEVSQLLNYNHPRVWNAVNVHHKIIEDNINFKILEPFLKQYKIFTEDEMEYFMSDSNDKQDKVAKLIDTLRSKNEKEIHDFVKALNEADKYTGHLAILYGLHEVAFQFPVTTV